MKPFTVITTMRRPAPGTKEFDNWAAEVTQWARDNKINIPTAISMGGATGIANWIWSEDSSFVDQLPPYCIVDNHDSGTCVAPDVDAAMASPEVFDIPLGNNIHDHPVPDDAQFVSVREDGKVKLYQRTESGSFRGLWTM